MLYYRRATTFLILNFKGYLGVEAFDREIHDYIRIITIQIAYLKIDNCFNQKLVGATNELFISLKNELVILQA